MPTLSEFLISIVISIFLFYCIMIIGGVNPKDIMS